MITQGVTDNYSLYKLQVHIPGCHVGMWGRDRLYASNRDQDYFANLLHTYAHKTDNITEPL